MINYKKGESSFHWYTQYRINQNYIFYSYFPGILDNLTGLNLHSIHLYNHNFMLYQGIFLILPYGKLNICFYPLAHSENIFLSIFHIWIHLNSILTYRFYKFHQDCIDHNHDCKINRIKRENLYRYRIFYHHIL